MMPPDNTRSWILRQFRRRKEPLPDPLFAGVGIFSLQRLGQSHTRYVVLSIIMVQSPDFFDMIDQILLQSLRQQGLTVLVPFAPDDG